MRSVRFLPAVFLFLASALPAAAEMQRTITVSGSGHVSAAPDMATISLGVTAQGKTAGAALTATSVALTTVISELKSAGIEPRDIRTSGLSLNPVWSLQTNSSPSRITGYSASNGVTVRMRDLAAVGPLLDKLVASGANTFNGLSFSLADPAAANDEARRRAVADAMARAKLYAEAAGVALGPVLSISEGGGYSPPVPLYRMAAEIAPAPVPVEGGEVDYSADVTIVFGIAD